MIWIGGGIHIPAMIYCHCYLLYRLLLYHTAVPKGFVGPEPMDSAYSRVDAALLVILIENNIDAD